jgi:NAD(P)-dependent dehydrogenase (short-subunit alcohol dehydrogenase family)
MDFDGRTVLVTGSRGMGREIAATMGARGASVAVVDLHKELAAKAATDAEAAGARAIAIGADVSSLEQVEAAVATVVAELGRVDYLVATAAVQYFDVGTILETTPEQWSKTLAVNLTGVYNCARACIPHMAAQGGGVVLATSSDCAVRTCIHSAAYVASKLGLIGLIRSIAVDHGHQNIRANVVIPGVTDTPALREVYASGERSLETQLKATAALSPLGRIGTTRDIAATVAFLCSDDASFLTGVELPVDGGMTVTYGAE